jgi:hypothetical protein
VNVEGNPEAPLLGEHVESWTKPWEHDNPLIRLSGRAFLAASSSLVLSIQAAEGLFFALRAILIFAMIIALNSLDSLE